MGTLTVCELCKGWLGGDSISAGDAFFVDGASSGPISSGSKESISLITERGKLVAALSSISSSPDRESLV